MTSQQEWLRPVHPVPGAAALRLRNPTVAWCGRCGLPWNACTSHDTPTGQHGVTISALCSACWGFLTVEERLPYYNRLLAWLAATGATDDHVHLVSEVQAYVRSGL